MESQNETQQCSARVVLLGASNLSLGFADIVATCARLRSSSLEISAAMGFGRSYGRPSRFFFKKNSGILASRIWDDLARSPDIPMRALISDVGNDLAYGESPHQVLEWVREVVDRLTCAGASMALTNLPLSSLRSVGELRYRMLRRVFFPACDLSRGELMARAEHLGESLGELAEARGIPFFSGEKAWYGLDPIHPRRRSAHRLWEAAVGVAMGSERPVAICRAGRQLRKVCRRLDRSSSSLVRLAPHAYELAGDANHYVALRAY